MTTMILPDYNLSEYINIDRQSLFFLQLHQEIETGIVTIVFSLYFLPLITNLA